MVGIRFGRRLAGALLISIVSVSCSGADAPAGGESPEVSGPPEEPATSLPEDEAVMPADTAVRALESSAVVVEAEVDGETVVFEGDLDRADDPFGEFVSCSGGRAAFTTYALVVSTTTGDVRALTVSTDDLVEEPGIHPATIHVELADGAVVDAVGSVTLEDGFRDGSFTAFTDDGALLKGTFACGAGAEPVPLPLGADDGLLDTVDAVALLRTAQGERLVSLVASAGQVADVRCPAVEDAAPDTDVVVRVDGDPSIGAMTTLELLGGGSPMLAMRVGAIDYRFDDVTVRVDGPAGTFSASADGITVDGAYRCT